MNKRVTSFYVETLILILVFVAVILALTQVFGLAKKQSEEARLLTSAVTLAQNAAEAFSAADSAESLRALLESFAIQLEELKELSRNEVKLRDKSAALIGRLAGDISATIGDAAHSEMLNGVDETASEAE